MTSEDTAAQHVVRTLRVLELLAEGPQTQAGVTRHLEIHRRTADLDRLGRHVREQALAFSLEIGYAMPEILPR